MHHYVNVTFFVYNFNGVVGVVSKLCFEENPVHEKPFYVRVIYQFSAVITIKLVSHQHEKFHHDLTIGQGKVKLLYVYLSMFLCVTVLKAMWS